MSIYLQLLLVAAVTIYIVDLSGFTQSWRSALARRMHVNETNLRPLKPFDCSLCMTWWTCLIYPLCTGDFSLLTLANAAALALLSQPLSAVMLFIVESLNWLFNKITPR